MDGYNFIPGESLKSIVLSIANATDSPIIIGPRLELFDYGYFFEYGWDGFNYVPIMFEGESDFDDFRLSFEVYGQVIAS